MIDAPTAQSRLDGVQEIAERAPLESDGGVEDHLRVVRRLRDPDLLVRPRHATFGGRDVGSPLEELGWDTHRDVGRERIQRARWNAELRGRLADQRRDGVLELRALHGDVGGLGASRIELCLGLGHVGLRGGAAFVPIGGELQGRPERLDTLVQELPLLIEGRVLWVAAETMVVVPYVLTRSVASAINVDLSQADQDEYAELKTGDSVAVTGVVAPDGDRAIATSIRRLGTS